MMSFEIVIGAFTDLANTSSVVYISVISSSNTIELFILSK